MSTDLEFRLPMIKINSSQASDITADDERCIIEEDCHTPRSPQHMIPTTLSCPPAPKKQRRTAACKRKLCDLQFFEMVAGEEVESLFRTVEVNLNGSTKRKCVI
ncbi:hypothetical protein Pfo_015565 [Paulownia fortunei]|nr:hypothetical protein Pfo_015565 [Paulownia fortunei]